MKELYNQFGGVSQISKNPYLKNYFKKSGANYGSQYFVNSHKVLSTKILILLDLFKGKWTD